MFKKELIELNEIAGQIADLEQQISKNSKEQKSLVALRSERQKAVLRSEKMLGGLPLSEREELLQVESLFAKRKALELQIKKLNQAPISDPRLLKLQRELEELFIEIQIKNALIRGLQGKYPLDGRPQMQRSFQRGVHFATKHPELIRKLQSTAVAIEEKKVELSGLRKSLRKAKGLWSRRSLALAKLVMAAQEQREFDSKILGYKLSIGLSQSYRNWVQQELSPSEDTLFEYLERRVQKLGVSRAHLDNFLAELKIDKRALIRTLEATSTPKLSKELSEGLLIFLKRTNEDLLKVLTLHLS